LKYDAFLSYSHAADGMLAPSLQAGLQAFARPWNRLRAIRVFRDKTGLAVTPSLWPAITAALDASEYFVLLASPRAVESDWVHQEVTYWLQHREAARILIVVTDGQIAWDPAANDFDWTVTTCVPEVIRTKVTEQPLWLDLRWARDQEHLSLQNPDFRNAIANLSSTIRGIPKDELIGEDVRQYRKSVRFRLSALSGLAVLAVALTCAMVIAIKQRNLARTNEGRALASEARARGELAAVLTSQPGQAAEALVIGVQVVADSLLRGANPNPSAISGLATALTAPAIPTVIDEGSQLSDPRFSPDGGLILAHGQLDVGSTSVVLFDARSGKAYCRIDTDVVNDAGFTPANDRIVVASGDRLLVAARRGCGIERTIQTGSEVASLAFAPDGKRVLAAGRGGVKLFDLDSGKSLARIMPDAEGETTVQRAIYEGPSPDRATDIAQAWLSADGSHVATLGFRSRWVKVWELDSGKQVARIGGEKASKVGAVAVNNSLLAVSTGSTIRIAGFDGRTLKTIDTGMVITILAVSPDGGYVCGSSLTRTSCWRLAGNGQRSLEMQGIVGRALSIAFDREGNRILVTGTDARARVYGLDGNLLFDMQSPLGALSSGLQQGTFSPGGERVVTGPNPIISWRLTGGAAGPIQPRSIASHGDLRVVLEGSLLKLITPTGAVPLGRIDPDYDVAYGAAFSPDGLTLAVRATDALSIWDPVHKIRLAEEREQELGRSELYFSPDNALLAAFQTIQGKFWIWNLRRPIQPPHVLNDVGYERGVTTPDLHWFAAKNVRSATVVDVLAGTKFSVGKELSWLTLTKDGDRLFGTREESSLRHVLEVWDLKSRARIAVSRDPYLNYSARPDGTRVIAFNVSLEDPKTMLLDGSLKPIAKLADSDKMFEAGFSPDGSVAWVLNEDVALWDATTGATIGRCVGYAGAIGSVAFSPDGKLLATLEDRAVRLWNSRDGTLLITYPKMLGEFGGVRFNFDGTSVIAGVSEQAEVEFPVSPVGLIKLACARLKDHPLEPKVAKQCAIP